MKFLAAFALIVGLVIGVEFAWAGVWPLSCVFGFVGLAGFLIWGGMALSHDNDERSGRKLTALTALRGRSWYPNYKFDDNPTARYLRDLDRQIKEIET